MQRYHTEENTDNQNSWSPGRPIKGCLEPNALDALRRAAEVHAGMPVPLPFKPRTAKASQPQRARKAVAA